MRFSGWLRFVGVLLLAWFHAGACLAEVGDSWRKSFPNNGVFGPYDIIWTGSHFVMVGSHYGTGEGAAKTSLDGRTWTTHSIPSGGQAVQGVCHLAGKVYACGGNGGIYRSMDGGLTWSRLGTVDASYLRGIAHTGTALVTVGSNGEIFVSYDEGGTWVEREVTTKPLNRVMWTGAELIAVGDGQTLLRSDDNGVTWEQGTLPVDFHGDVNSICEMPGGGLMAAGSAGKVVFSNDGGQSWTAKGGASVGNVEFRCVVPMNGGLIGFAENAYVYRAATLNGDWEFVSVGRNRTVTNGILHGDSVICVGSNGNILGYDGSTGKLFERTAFTTKAIARSRVIRGKVWAVGDDGQVLFSTDGGASWEHSWLANGGGRVADIAETSTGIMCSGYAGVYVSDDEGVTWQFKAIEGASFCTSLAVVGETWLAGTSESRIYRSTDRGATWTYYQHQSPTYVQFIDMDVSGSRVVAVCSNGAIVTSDNAGLGWALRTSPVTSWLQCVFAVSDTVWLAGGSEGVLLRSTNGGVSWSALWTGTWVQDNQTITGFCKTPSAVIASVRFTGLETGSAYPTLKVLRSLDSGSSWSGVPTGCSSSLTAVVWTGESVLMMGDKGAMLKAPAIGYPWTLLSGASEAFFNDVERAGDSLFAVGNAGLVAESTDHGSTWKILESGINTNLRAITWTGTSLLAMSYSAPTTVLRSTNRGVTWNAVVNGNFPSYCDDIGSGNGGVILLSTGGYRISLNDGVTWSTPATNTIPNSMLHVEWANGYFYGYRNNTSNGSLSRSATGGASSWTTLSTSSPAWHVAGMDGQIFGATYNGLVGTSMDSGVTWQSRQANVSPYGFTSVEWTGRHLVATMTDGSIRLSGGVAPNNYLAWAAAAGVSGAAAVPNAMRADGLTNLFVYAWDHDRDGFLSVGERSQMPKVTRHEGAGAHVLSFLLPPADRDDLLVGLEKMQVDGSWTRLATKDGARAWQGSPVPVMITQADQYRRVEVAVDPAVEARAFYRLAFEVR